MTAFQKVEEQQEREAGAVMERNVRQVEAEQQQLEEERAREPWLWNHLGRTFWAFLSCA